jgi:N-methylhydantoinase A
MVDMRTIGAGGGSIATVQGGRLRVGPESAGAKPGPVCYGRGGAEPTTTDANVVLGRLDAVSFMRGALPLDASAAREAMRLKVAEPLGLQVEAAAEGVLAVVTARLAGAIKLSLFERGLDPRDFALMSFGGAGGLHAVEVAEELGMTKVVFPKDPSTFSAHGILQSDIVHDLARARISTLAPEAAAAIGRDMAELAAEGRRLLAADTLPGSAHALQFSADLRYRGQAFELMLPLDGETFAAADSATLAARFHALHRQRFSFDDPGQSVELVTLRLAAIGRLDAIAGRDMSGGMAEPPSQPRAVFLRGAWRQVAVIRQQDMAAGAVINGPAIIEQDYTSLLVPAGWRLTVSQAGDMVAEMSGGLDDGEG